MTARLRDMVESDLATVLVWRNADDVRRNMYTYHTITPIEHRQWWDSQGNNPTTRLLIAEIEGEPVGVITFSNYTGVGGTATWAFYSGNLSRRGTGTMMERAALEYAFESLGVRKLSCEVLSFNQRVIDFHLRFGFTVEGVFRDAYSRDGKLYDICRLAMLQTEWSRFVRPHLLDTATAHPVRVGQPLIYKLDLSHSAVDAFACMTGDMNPLHSDESFALAQGFKGRVAHGMIVGCALTRIFGQEYPGRGTVYVSQALEFIAPMYVDVPAKIELTLKSRVRRRVSLHVSVRQGELECVTGEAVLLEPKEMHADHRSDEH